MKPTIILILALLSGAASADDIYFTLGGWSSHSDNQFRYCPKQTQLEVLVNGSECQDFDYNGNHKSVIVDYKGATIGTYKNSYGARTNLAGYTYRHKNYSATVAYGTGYVIDGIDDSCGIKIDGKGCLLVSLAYTIDIVKFSLMGQALAVSFEFSF